MKKFSLLLILVLAAVTMNAQEQRVSDKPVYFSNSAKDNWFMSLGGGTNMYLTKGDNDADVDFTNRLGWMGQLSVGRWNSPTWGARLVVDGGAIKHNLQKTTTDAKWLGGHVDLMYNLTNAVVGYNPERAYSFIPYFGVGYMYGMDKDWKRPNPDMGVFQSQNQALTYNLGIINNFQMSKNVGLFFELAFRVLDGSFDYQNPGLGKHISYDGFATAQLGVSFGLGGKQEFTPAELMDYNLINDLNSQINRLRAENETLSKRPEFCPDCPEVEPAPVVEGVYVPNVVFFRIDSYKIDKDQQISIFNTAEYLKTNPNATVKVVAYADKLTGYPEYNMKLSERRAKAVADALTAEYGIDSSRISVDWKGDTEQPYEVNEWNRVAIFLAD